MYICTDEEHSWPYPPISEVFQHISTYRYIRIISVYICDDEISRPYPPVVQAFLCISTCRYKKHFYVYLYRWGGFMAIPSGLHTTMRFSSSNSTCCSALQCVAVCCSVLQCVAVCRRKLQREHAALSCTLRWDSRLPIAPVAVCCNVQQRVALSICGALSIYVARHDVIHILEQHLLQCVAVCCCMST